MSVVGHFLPPGINLSEETPIGKFARSWASLKRGESLVYHTGSLARDRVEDEDIDRLARLALTLGMPRGTPMSWCYAIGLEEPPLGVAILTQRKVKKGRHIRYDYVITKRKTRAVSIDGHVAREAMP